MAVMKGKEIVSYLIYRCCIFTHTEMCLHDFLSQESHNNFANLGATCLDLWWGAPFTVPSQGVNSLGLALCTITPRPLRKESRCLIQHNLA